MSDDKTDWCSVSDNAHAEFKREEAAKSEEERLQAIEQMIAILLQAHGNLRRGHFADEIEEFIEKVNLHE